MITMACGAKRVGSCCETELRHGYTSPQVHVMHGNPSIWHQTESDVPSQREHNERIAMTVG